MKGYLFPVEIKKTKKKKKKEEKKKSDRRVVRKRKFLHFVHHAENMPFKA